MLSEAEKKFKSYYKSWIAFIRSPDASEFSSDAEYINNAYFQKIVDLGEKVLPAIVKKMKEDLEGHFLVHAMEKITGHRFSQEEITAGIRKYGSPLGNQGFAKLWIDWWEKQPEGR